jgi:hypothetical protein
MYSIVIGLLLQITAYSQSKTIQTDSSLKDLKKYLKKHVKFPSIELKDYTQGTMILNFEIKNDQKIGKIYFSRHLTNACDSIVIKVLRNFSKKVSLTPDQYSIGLRFLILEDGKPDSGIIPIDKSNYKNFLFELDITGELPREKPTIVY